MLMDLLRRLRRWCRERHLGGYTHTPPRTPPAHHAGQNADLARAGVEMDALEEAVTTLAGRHGAERRDRLVQRVIRSQGRVLDALAAERWQFDEDMRRADSREGYP